MTALILEHRSPFRRRSWLIPLFPEGVLSITSRRRVIFFNGIAPMRLIEKDFGGKVRNISTIIGQEIINMVLFKYTRSCSKHRDKTNVKLWTIKFNASLFS